MLRYGGGILDLLSEEDRAILFEVALLETHPAGTTILREGESGGDVYVVLAGRCEVDIQGDRVGGMGGGQLFGEIGALTGSLRTATVVATEACELLRLPPEALSMAMARSPMLTNLLLRTLAIRTKTISDREVAFRSEQRQLEKVERAMLPDPDVMSDSATFGHDVHWRPYSFASGDYCDIVPLGGDRFLVAVGDVLGHGAQTSPTVGAVRSQVRNLAMEGLGPGALLPRLDAHLFRHGPPGLHVTLVVAELDGAASTIRFATAGHPLPVLYRRGSASPLENAPGPLLGYGFSDEQLYPEAEQALEAGDRLLFFTDGLSEIRTREGPDDTFLGEEGVARMFQDVCAGASAQIARALIDRVEADGGLNPPDDDAAALVVHVRGP